MRKILVFSDSHGNLTPLIEVLKKEKNYDTVFHLGDMEEDFNVLRRELDKISPLAALLPVRGNCDTTAILPGVKTPEYEGQRFFLTHGHIFMGGDLYSNLARAAKAEGCGYVLFGHTHYPHDEMKNGVRLLNPGSISRPRQTGHEPSYGVLEISDAGEVTWEQRFISVVY